MFPCCRAVGFYISFMLHLTAQDFKLIKNRLWRDKNIQYKLWWWHAISSTIIRTKWNCISWFAGCGNHWKSSVFCFKSVIEVDSRHDLRTGYTTLILYFSSHLKLLFPFSFCWVWGREDGFVPFYLLLIWMFTSIIFLWSGHWWSPYAFNILISEL